MTYTRLTHILLILLLLTLSGLAVAVYLDPNDFVLSTKVFSISYESSLVKNCQTIEDYLRSQVERDGRIIESNRLKNDNLENRISELGRRCEELKVSGGTGDCRAGAKRLLVGNGQESVIENEMDRLSQEQRRVQAENDDLRRGEDEKYRELRATCLKMPR